MAESQVQNEVNEENPPAETTTKRRKLTAQDAARIVKEWDQKSVNDFAREFGVVPNTVRAMVYELRKMDSSLCPKGNRAS
jgi:transposase-like protein